MSNYARKIDTVAEQYRASREALARLQPDSEYLQIYKFLQRQDIRPIEMNASDMDASDDDSGKLTEAAREELIRQPLAC